MHRGQVGLQLKQKGYKESSDFHKTGEMKGKVKERQDLGQKGQMI